MVALGDTAVAAPASEGIEIITEEEALQQLAAAKRAEAKASRVAKAEAMLAESLAADYRAMSGAEWVAPKTRRNSVTMGRIEDSIRYCKCATHRHRGTTECSCCF